MGFQRFLAFAIVGIAAFLAGIAIPRLRQATVTKPVLVVGKETPLVRPTPSQLVTTFQGVRNAAGAEPDALVEEWVVLDIRKIQDAGPVHRFDYVLSSTQGSEYGVGSLSLPEGVVHIGNLTGDARVLPDGRLQMGSRLVDGPSYWRCTSRRPADPAP